MTTALLSMSPVAVASYSPGAPPDNTAWDVLFVAIGLVVLLGLIVAVGAYMNHREDRRHGA